MVIEPVSRDELVVDVVASSIGDHYLVPHLVENALVQAAVAMDSWLKNFHTLNTRKK